MGWEVFVEEKILDEISIRINIFFIIIFFQTHHYVWYTSNIFIIKKIKFTISSAVMESVFHRSAL